MKSLGFILSIIILPLTTYSQKFILDTSNIIKHKLIFDTSKTFQNDDLFVLQNVIIVNHTNPITLKREKLSGEAFIFIISKVNSEIILEKLVINGNIDKSGFPFKRKVLMYEDFFNINCYVNFYLKPNSYYSTSFSKGEIKIELYYKINGKHKKIKIDEVKVVETLIKWNYLKDRDQKWKTDFKQF